MHTCFRDSGRNILAGVAGLLLLVLFFSCTPQETCDGDTQSVLVARFGTGETGSPADTTVGGVTVYGIREGKSDSLLVDSASVSRLQLPLDPGHGESRFVLRAGQQSDTLVIRHGNTAYLISYACGFGMLFTLQEIGHTMHLIRAVEVINEQVDAELLKDEAHIRIFF